MAVKGVVLYKPIPRNVTKESSRDHRGAGSVTQTRQQFAAGRAGYLPTQKREKISVRRDSVGSDSVMDESWASASRRSRETTSKG